METARQHRKMTEAEYLAFENDSDREQRCEFVDGRLVAMVGAARPHVLIVANLMRHLGNALAGTPCAPMSNDFKVRSPRGTYRYPDIVIECGGDGGDTYYSEDPVLIVEVISESTRRIDERDKPLEYFNIPSLKEYVLIEQDFVKVQVLRREQNWRADTYFLGDTIRFDSIDLDLPVENVYERVQTAELAAWRARNAAKGSPGDGA